LAKLTGKYYSSNSPDILQSVLCPPIEEIIFPYALITITQHKARVNDKKMMMMIGYDF